MESMKLYDLFRQLFPLFDIQAFRKVGEYSLQIDTSVPGISFIFTFRSPVEWRLETTNMYGKELAKENSDEFE